MNPFQSVIRVGCFLVFASISGLLIGQEKEIVKSIEAAGGRVSQISAAGPEREVNFGLAGKDVTNNVLPLVAKLKNVVWLNLKATEITDDGLKAIAAMDQLKRLHLEKTSISDKGLTHLSAMKNLTYLNLYGTKVTDAGLKHLEGLANLRKVYVWQSQVTETGIADFRKRRPKVEIVGELKLTPPKVIADGADKKKMEGKKASEKKADEKKKTEKKTEAKKG